jgi:murein L,D-transpeptidase YcbB/YkuD
MGYWELKNGIKKFLDSMDKRVFTYLVYPIKNNDQKDSLLFVKNFQKRLSESNFIELNDKLPDSIDLAKAIKKFQRKKGVKQDGMITAKLIRSINTNDIERFNRIAITLDRYKLLPDSMPEKYIWVNLPAYYLQLWDHDTVVFQSKIICGKPETRTPLLQSNITDMVTYPTWTVPSSIIEKQYLPKLKGNPNYLSKIGLKLVDKHGEFIDPVKIKWSKYKKGIPYKIVQNSGDDNALGVIKFNFKNPYAVYLHDTNQRYLFKNISRALSHGCVRVQDWEKLAYYIAKNDSLNLSPAETLQYTVDSIKRWISIKKHKWIGVKNQLPLFITYFGCEGKNGKIKFYEDIYVEDKVMREKYFTVN